LAASVADLDDAIQLELVSTILTEGRSARLVRDLLEESDLVQDLAGSFSMQMESALFSISTYLDVENLEIVEQRIMQQVQDLHLHPISDAELNKAKRSLCNHFTFALESPSQLASFLGYHSLLGCEELCTDWANAYCDIIRNVQPLDLQKLVQKYLSLESYIVTSVIPQ
jgi:predicted Zn-dependent peptidase